MSRGDVPVVKMNKWFFLNIKFLFPNIQCRITSIFSVFMVFSRSAQRVRLWHFNHDLYLNLSYFFKFACWIFATKFVCQSRILRIIPLLSFGNHSLYKPNKKNILVVFIPVNSCFYYQIIAVVLWFSLRNCVIICYIRFALRAKVLIETPRNNEKNMTSEPVFQNIPKRTHCKTHLYYYCSDHIHLQTNWIVL